MIELRPRASLGHIHQGWLHSIHHFSFGDHFDPARMGWGGLRVWNDDKIAPQSGFPLHPHQDMEIITYVREGAITHQDSLGNTGRTEAGDVQVMSAGTGIRHSEQNLETEPTRIFQIWIQPSERGGAPRWGAKPFPKGKRAGRLVAPFALSVPKGMRWYLVYRGFRTGQRDFAAFRRWIIRAATGPTGRKSSRHAG